MIKPIQLTCIAELGQNALQGRDPGKIPQLSPPLLAALLGAVFNNYNDVT